MNDLVPSLRAGGLVGLFEGLVIIRYERLGGPWQPMELAEAMGDLALVLGVQLGIWLAVAALLLPLRKSVGVFRPVLTAWAACAYFARHALDDRSTNASQWLIIVPLVIAWVVLPRWWEKVAEPMRTSLAAVAILAVSCFALLGRVPDHSYGAATRLWLYSSSAILALGLVGLAWRRPRIAAVAATALLLAPLVPWLVQSSADPARRPNVLWILVDTLRRDHVPPYGDKVHNRAIETLASSGVRFDDAVTVTPKTPASVASFFTGRYPIHHGVRALYDAFPDDQQTVAERFQEAGYDTAAFVNNAWLSRGRGFGQGFRRFASFYELSHAYGVLDYVGWVVALDALTLRRIRPFQGQTKAQALTDSVIDYLRQDRGRPFFVYAHYFEPHWPYFPPAAQARLYGGPEDGDCAVNHIRHTNISRGRMIFQNPLPEEENEAARLLYRGEVDHTLAEIGRLVDELDTTGHRDDTIVVFTADHGHSLGQHDYYFHHGSFLYDDSIRIPLVLRWPGRIPAATVVEGQVRSIDLAPTLLELAGLSWSHQVDGSSLARSWTESKNGAREAFLESDVKMFGANQRRKRGGVLGKLRSVRNGRYKLILNPEVVGGRFELYDLESDPFELHNLVEDQAYTEVRDQLVDRLTRLLPARERLELARIGGDPGGGEGLDKELDETDRELLESLGYL